MQIVINIDKDIAYHIINGSGDIPRNTVRSFQATIADAIKNGTPLSQGHGRLLVLSEECVKEHMLCLDAFQQKFIGEVDLSNAIVGVIEADKENKDDKGNNVL